jgi:hypothetical protein
MHNIGPHVGDDVLERYLLRRLTEAEIPPVEEHLLVCEECQDQMAETENFMLATRVALQKQARKPAGIPFRTRLLTLLRPRYAMPVMAMALFSVGLGVYMQPRQLSPGATLPEVSLTAMRGPDSALPHVRADHGLVLNLPGNALPAAADAYQVRIVNSDGVEIWIGIPQLMGNGIRAVVSRQLNPGHYWVRLTRGPELLHEYGVRAD